MSYIDGNLLAGESVTYRTRLHWKMLLGAILFDSLVCVPIAIVLLMKIEAKLWVLAPVVLGAVVLAVAVLRRASSELAVTNKRVILKVGLLETRSVELLLSKVEAIGVTQGVLGKMLGYGDIVVTGSGGTKEVFAGIQSPLDFRRAVQQQTSDHLP